MQSGIYDGLVAVVTRSAVKSTKTRHSSRLSASATSHTLPTPAAAASSLPKRRSSSSKAERSSRGRGRPPREPRRSARKKLRLCVGDFLYSQGTSHTHAHLTASFPGQPV